MRPVHPQPGTARHPHLARLATRHLARVATRHLARVATRHLARVATRHLARLATRHLARLAAVAQAGVVTISPAPALASLLLGSGVLHFTTPKPFDAIVPHQLPGRARTYTQVSGAAELAIAAALAVPRTRRLGGTLAAALFVAVFPANLQMAVDWLRSDTTSAPAKAAAVARLPLQIPLVVAALKVRRGA